ncbi:4-hydroxythreonine-4-phosphate dehydrogenase PdxA [Bacteroidales bacterium OttesenSCG-928-C03]|nr:4-hydroxythreonine-4-phosphate dehydrogenase PdxA [Bacteroidales bacterium OttesenSCG-928-E04]MDL2308129.1 4-hydroxythreonine-4-phosphate dehydrogenase PdxA [Bacteroidales bacterium OttesenSCG-928-C03]MDL2325555.1 4-hydroxythreonine-4-phosphate dehydrogenase PdxA [Bacteroidales bacterium OttesenSCG-928-A14]
MSEKSLFTIGITQGDLNGIGYEVIIKALHDKTLLELCTPAVYGLAKVSSYYRKNLDMNEFSFQFVKSINQLSLKRPNLVNIADEEVKIEPGTPTPISGKMAELALNVASKDLKDNLIDAIVTGPIDKSNIQSDTFKFQGHTEYFMHHFKTNEAMMMMISPLVKIGFATNHAALKDVSSLLTPELIIKKLKVLQNSLVQDFACTNPKIAVLSLNPHAGDNKLLGKEEDEVIKPAILQAYDQGINAVGPFAADGFFGSGNYQKFDAVLAMYHDQGMIPFKLLSLDEGVNYTAGLPCVRTSPAHGTAFDIAGKNKSSGQSMRSAIYLAIDILRNRKIFAGYATQKKSK